MSKEFEDLGFEEDFDDLGFEEEGIAVESAVPETKPSGGFLGADLSALAGTDSSANLADAIQGISTGVVEGARNVPVLGPLVEKGALALTGEDPEAFKQRREEAVAESPIASTIGGLAGTMGGFAAAPASIPAQLGLSAADMITRAATGQEDMTLGEGALNLGMEAGLSAGTFGLSKLMQALPKLLKTQAGVQAEKAAGLDATKTLRDKLAKLESTGKINKGDIGNELLDRGVVQAGSSAETIAEKALLQKELAGESIGDVLGEKTTSTKLAQQLLEGKLDGTALSKLQKKIKGKIETQIDMLKAAGEKVSLKDLNKIKSEYGAEVKDFMSKAPNKIAAKKMYSALTESIEQSLGEKELAKLREANKRYQAMTMASESAGSHAQRPLTSGLSDSAAIYGTATGNLVLPVIVAGKALWRKYGNSMAAAGMKQGSNFTKHLAKIAAAAEQGPSALSALHFKLMQEDEEYRKSHSKEDK